MEQLDADLKDVFLNVSAVNMLLDTLVDAGVSGMAELKEILDVNSFKLENTELLGANNRAYRCDCLYSVKSRDGTEQIFFLLLMEFQSKYEKFYAVRVNHYTACIYERLRVMDDDRQKSI